MASLRGVLDETKRSGVWDLLRFFHSFWLPRDIDKKRPETEGDGQVQVAKSEKVKSSDMLRNLGFMEEISIYKLKDHVFYLIDYGHYKLNKCTMMNGTIWRWFVD